MNYIIFMPDEMRADTLGCYGNGVAKTPAFDRLAAEGTLFEQCHVQNPVCSPSRCCLFTGRYVHEDGHRSLYNLIKPDEHNLMGELRQAGYQVRVFGKNDLLAPEAVALNTDSFENHPHKDAKMPENTRRPGEVGYYNFVYQPLDMPPENHKDAQNLAAALDFVESWKEGDKPFFLFLPMEMPHCPYTIMEPYYSMYSPEDMPPLAGPGTNKPAYHSLIRQYRNMEGDPELKKLRAVYQGMVSYADWLLGRLMDKLDETGLAQSTMLVAVSDHGDYAGDYGLTEKWPSGMEDVLTHVPLIIRGPGCAQGHRVKAPVEMFDIMPTILEAAQVQPRHAFHAQSLWPALGGGEGDMARTVFCEGGYNPEDVTCNEAWGAQGSELEKHPQNPYLPKILQQKQQPDSVRRAVMARTLTHKLVLRSGGGCEFYNLQTDPMELDNLYADAACQPTISAMKETLLHWYLNTSDSVPYERDPRGV